MKLTKKLLDFLKRAFSSKGGQIVFLINLALIVYVFTKEGVFSPSEFHCDNDVLTCTMLIPSFPALITAAIIAIPLNFAASYLTLNYIYPALIVTFWTIQWVSAGYGLEKLFRKYILKNKS